MLQPENFHARLRLTYLLLALGALLVACSRGDHAVNAALDSIASVVEEHPDSALTILNRLDSLLDARAVSLQGESQRARYALLKSQTLDKNWIDVTDDSLIRIAVDYYDRHGDEHERMMAYFYLGGVLMNQENYALAYVSYKKAENFALLIHDNHFLWLIYGCLSTICYDTYSNEAIQYANKSLHYAEIENDTIGILFCQYQLAQSYSLAQKYDTAEILFKHIIECLPPEHYIVQSCLTPFVEQCIVQGKNDYAYTLLSYCDTLVHPVDLMNMALILNARGEINRSDQYIDKANSVVSDSAQRVFFYNKLSQIAIGRKDFISAIEYERKAGRLQSIIVSDILSQAVASFQKDYEKQQKEIEKSRYLQQRNMTVAIITLSLLVIFILGAYSYNALRTIRSEVDTITAQFITQETSICDKNAAIESMERSLCTLKRQNQTYATQLKDLSDKLADKEREKTQLMEEAFTVLQQQSALKLKISNMEMHLAEARKGADAISRKLLVILSRRFNMADRLGVFIFKMQGKPFLEKRIAEMVLQEMKKLSEDKKTISEIDAMLDGALDNIMTIAKGDSFKLNDKEIRLLRYMMMNLSNRSIAYLMEIEDSLVLYKRKDRLKHKILECNNQEAKKILQYLSSEAEIGREKTLRI